MRRLFCTLLACTPLAAVAGDAVLNWTPPTTYTDGTPLPAAEITSYRISYGQTAGGPYGTTVTVAGTATTTTITNLAKGTWYFVARTVASNGLESATSAQVAKTVLGTAAPNPPVLR